MRNILALLALLISPAIVLAEPVEFSLSSRDGLARISGQIDKPTCDTSNYPLVIIVGGTGLFYRNGYFGESGTERDFLFSDLAKRFNETCIATVRFDYRGVSCDLKGESETKNCLNQEARAYVTDETILDDIQLVYDHTIKQSFIDSKKVVFLGHSEGSLNISRLVARNSIAPLGLMFFGGLTESAYSILHWQIAIRPVTWAFEMDANIDGHLSNEEIKEKYSSSKLNGIFPIEHFLSSETGWTVLSLSAHFEEKFAEFKKTFLAIDDSEPYRMGKIIFSSYKWWKRWFWDDVSVLENLKEFAGPIEYHNGDIDSQTPSQRELDFLNSSKIEMKSRPRFVVHPGLGHGLGEDQLYGPMDETVAGQIVDSVKSWVIER